MLWVISWGTFWIGHAVSLVMDIHDTIGETLYPVYNKLMGWSISAQFLADDQSAFPWQKPVDND